MILLLESEARRLADKTTLNVDCFASRIDGFEPYTYTMRKTVNGKCIFLYDKLCSIYEDRPLICRFYPFQLIALEDEHYVFKETSECPGISKGTYVGKSSFQRMFAEATSLMRDKK